MAKTAIKKVKPTQNTEFGEVARERLPRVLARHAVAQLIADGFEESQASLDLLSELQTLRSDIVEGSDEERLGTVSMLTRIAEKKLPIIQDGY